MTSLPVHYLLTTWIYVLPTRALFINHMDIYIYIYICLTPENGLKNIIVRWNPIKKGNAATNIMFPIACITIFDICTQSQNMDSDKQSFQYLYAQKFRTSPTTFLAKHANQNKTHTHTRAVERLSITPITTAKHHAHCMVSFSYQQSPVEKEHHSEKKE